MQAQEITLFIFFFHYSSKMGKPLWRDLSLDSGFSVAEKTRASAETPDGAFFLVNLRVKQKKKCAY
jgi:hypothetical protein